MGEFDWKFGDNNLTITYPDHTQDVWDVSTTTPGKFILTKGDKTVVFVYETLKYLKHTISVGLSSYGKDAPESFKAGMNSNHANNFVLWKCTSWAGKACKFDHAEAPPKRQLK